MNKCIITNHCSACHEHGWLFFFSKPMPVKTSLHTGRYAFWQWHRL